MIRWDSKQVAAGAVLRRSGLDLAEIEDIRVDELPVGHDFDELLSKYDDAETEAHRRVPLPNHGPLPTIHGVAKGSILAVRAAAAALAKEADQERRPPDGLGEAYLAGDRRPLEIYVASARRQAFTKLLVEGGRKSRSVVVATAGKLRTLCLSGWGRTREAWLRLLDHADGPTPSPRARGSRNPLLGLADAKDRFAHAAAKKLAAWGRGAAASSRYYRDFLLHLMLQEHPQRIAANHRVAVKLRDDVWRDFRVTVTDPGQTASVHELTSWPKWMGVAPIPFSGVFGCAAGAADLAILAHSARRGGHEALAEALERSRHQLAVLGVLGLLGFAADAIYGASAIADQRLLAHLDARDFVEIDLVSSSPPPEEQVALPSAETKLEAVAVALWRMGLGLERFAKAFASPGRESAFEDARIALALHLDSLGTLLESTGRRTYGAAHFAAVDERAQALVRQDRTGAEQCVVEAVAELVLETSMAADEAMKAQALLRTNPGASERHGLEANKRIEKALEAACVAGHLSLALSEPKE